MDGGVVMLTEYTADSGNATSSVCHCGHNRIKAAAITNYRCYPFQNSLQSCTANKKWMSLFVIYNQILLEVYKGPSNIYGKCLPTYHIVYQQDHQSLRDEWD